MSTLSSQIIKIRSWAIHFDGRSDFDPMAPLLARDLREAADTIESLRERLQAETLGAGECEPIVGDGENGVPLYQTGCSNCGCPWDWFYNTPRWDGPPKHCPDCGARVREEAR